MERKPIEAHALYKQVHDELAQRISLGVWKSGSAIPNEMELAREFGLSIGTVRKALGLLENEHLIVRHVGRGSFVNDTPKEYIPRYRRLRTMDGGPIVFRVTSLSLEVGEATDEELVRIEARKGTKVWRVKRLYEMTEEPLMVERATLPVSVYPGETLADGGAHDLVSLAHHYGILLGRGKEYVSFITPPADVAGLLALKPQDPVAQFDRVVYTIDGRVAEWRVSICNMRGKKYFSEFS